MEHRLYILSDTPVDVVYGFACIGLVGLLWSGVGGAILAMAFTRPRSELNRFIGPLKQPVLAIEDEFQGLIGLDAGIQSFDVGRWHNNG